MCVFNLVFGTANILRVCPSALFHINFPFLSKEGNNSDMLFDKILYIIFDNIDIYVFEI